MVNSGTMRREVARDPVPDHQGEHGDELPMSPKVGHYPSMEFVSHPIHHS
jgi:hypothetical protein